MTKCPATGKEIFTTAPSAYKRVNQLSKRRKDRADDKFTHGQLNAYRCRYCHGYHVGHRPITDRVQKIRHLMGARA